MIFYDIYDFYDIFIVKIKNDFYDILFYDILNDFIFLNFYWIICWEYIAILLIFKKYYLLRLFSTLFSSF